MNLVIFLKVNIYLQDMYKNVYFRCFLCATCLPASLIIHVPISEPHAQWHWCLHFSMSLNSQRFLQFHPTIIFFSQEFCLFVMVIYRRTDRNLCSKCVFMKIKENGWTPCKGYLNKKTPQNKRHYTFNKNKYV